MQFISGRWEGTLFSEDGAQSHFSLSQPELSAAPSPADAPAAITLQGGVRAALRLLEGARNVMVALADAVPDPISGRPAQLLFEARVRGDRMVGEWLRRDGNGVIQATGRLTAVRTACTV